MNGIQFIGATGTPSKPYFLSAEGPNYFYNDYNRLPGQSSLQGPGVSSVFYSVTNGVTTINMPPGGVTAFGMVLFDALVSDKTGAGTDTVNLNINGSTGSVVTPAFTGTAFIGFTSTVPVTSVTLTGTKADEYPTISSVYYQPAVTLATPLISCGGISPYSTHPQRFNPANGYRSMVPISPPHRPPGTGTFQHCSEYERHH